MRAHLGDQLVIESPATGATRREGETVGLHHEDGTPPYDVRWSDSDQVTLVFPGPDAHVHHLDRGRPGVAVRLVRAVEGVVDVEFELTGDRPEEASGAGRP